MTRSTLVLYFLKKYLAIFWSVKFFTAFLALNRRHCIDGLCCFEVLQAKFYEIYELNVTVDNETIIAQPPCNINKKCTCGNLKTKFYVC